VGAIFLIVGVSGLLFFVLALAMKRTTPEASLAALEDRLRACAICQDEFAESEMVTRKVGEAGYLRYFCDRCVIELYEESRLLHDPRSKD
jgi:hypothetical protein